MLARIRMSRRLVHTAAGRTRLATTFGNELICSRRVSAWVWNPGRGVIPSAVLTAAAPAIEVTCGLTPDLFEQLQQLTDVIGHVEAPGYFERPMSKAGVYHGIAHTFNDRPR